MQHTLNIPARENAEAWETDGQLAPATRYFETMQIAITLTGAGMALTLEVFAEKASVILESKWFTRAEPLHPPSFSLMPDAIQRG